MKKTVLHPFLKKICVLAAGLLACLLALELGLDLAGWAGRAARWLGNRSRAHAKTDWVVACFGESMTAGTYPPVLQKALEAKYPGLRFTVVDEGLQSTSSGYICDILDEALRRDRPDVILVMTGVNDEFDPVLCDHKPLRQAPGGWYTRLSTYRLARYLWVLHLKEIWTARFKPRPPPPPGPARIPEPERTNPSNWPDWIPLHRFAARQPFTFITQPYSPGIPGRDADPAPPPLPPEQVGARIGQAVRLVRQRQYDEAQAVYLPLIEHDSETFCNLNGHGALVHAYLEAKKGEPPARLDGYVARMLQRIVEVRPNEHTVYDVYAFLWMSDRPGEALRFLRPIVDRFPGPLDYVEGMILQRQGRLDEAQQRLELSFARNPLPDSRTVFDLIALYTLRGRDDLGIELIRKALALSPRENNRNRLYANLAVAYQNRGRTETAQQYRQLADPRFTSRTYDNCRRIVRAAAARRVRVLLMQYPMISPAPLEAVAADTFPSQVGVVGNEKDFFEGVARKGYSHYFRDTFGGLFGHPTQAGCELIAAHVVEALDPILRQGHPAH